MCKVLNKHVAGPPAGAVYIGRGSKWGNPFRIGSDGDRAAVIARHEAWLRDQHGLLRAIGELKGKDLVFLRARCVPRRSSAAAGERLARGHDRLVAGVALSRRNLMLPLGAPWFACIDRARRLIGRVAISAYALIKWPRGTRPLTCPIRHALSPGSPDRRMPSAIMPRFAWGRFAFHVLVFAQGDGVAVPQNLAVAARRDMPALAQSSSDAAPRVGQDRRRCRLSDEIYRCRSVSGRERPLASVCGQTGLPGMNHDARVSCVSHRIHRHAASIERRAAEAVNPLARWQDGGIPMILPDHGGAVSACRPTGG